MSEHSATRLLPLSYRTELFDQIMPALKAGECCSLVGISGSGKSNLVQFLRRDDVQLKYWGSSSVWVVLVDTHTLAFGEQPPEYVVAELMIHRLIMEAERRALQSDVLQWADELHLRLANQPSGHLALRYLERLCARLCDSLGIQLVFVFDQFEDLWRLVDARFFLNLRNLRDQFKYRVMYLVMTRERLQRLRSDLKAVEAFWELFASHTFGLRMYSPGDARTMLERLAARRNDELDFIREQLILRISGRHPGLLRAVFWVLSGAANTDHSWEALLEKSSIADECAKIWDDFLPDEQRLVRIIAADLPIRDPHVPAMAELRLKGVVEGEPPELFSSLFVEYIRRQAEVEVSGIVVDAHQRQVWLDGQLLAKPLPRLEFQMLVYLARNAGTICKREAILEELYPGQGHVKNDERLDTILRRLREVLNEDAQNPRYLITHRGVGVQLTLGHIEE